MLNVMKDPRTKVISYAGARDRSALVFVVDDQQVVAELTAAILELDGYSTRIFHDPAEAIKALDSDEISPDLLLTDYQMPNQNGLDLIESCTRSRPELRTILCSGSVQRSIYANRTVKPDEFIEKPFVPKHLLDVVQEMLAE